MATAHVDHDLTSPSPRRALIETLAGNWWLLLLRGIAAIVLGVLTLVWPGLALFTLILMWGIYLLVDGIAAVAAAVFGRGVGIATPRWWLAIAGLVSIVAGTVALVWPGLTGQLLLVLIAAWAVAMGATQILGALELRKDIAGEWLLGLSGLVSILFGFILLARPGAGALAVAWLFGTFAILFGFIEVSLALEVKTHRREG